MKNEQETANALSDCYRKQGADSERDADRRPQHDHNQHKRIARSVELDEEEERVKDEEQYDDELEECKDYPSDDEENDVRLSYNAYLRSRERFYPYSNNHNMYRNRFTLLSHSGRIREYFRFGMVCGFNQRIYPTRCRYFYMELMKREGLMDHDHRPRRRVDVHTLSVPCFFKDDRDKVIEVPRSTDNDVAPHYYVMRDVPIPLRIEPPPIPGAPMLTVEAVIARAIKQKKLYNSVNDQAEATRERETARRQMEMDAAEYSYGDVQIEQDLADQMPQLEANTFQQHSSASSASVPITISASKLTAPFAFSYPNEAATLLKQERMMASMDRKPTSITTASKGVKKEGGVLGAIWDELDGDTRALIAATRDNKPLTSEVLGKKEKEACSSSVLSFDGNPNNAPAYFNELCIKLGQYAYQSDNAIRIMFATMKGVART
jgi:hypothetical protein